MELHQAGVIRQVYGEREVNELIGQGWALLAVTSGYDHRQGAAAPCYVLGQPKTKKDPLAGLTAADLVRANNGL